MTKQLIILAVIVAIYFIQEWWKQRQERARRAQDGFDPASRTGAPDPASSAPKTSNWEEELRRLLEGDPVAPPPGPPASPAPAPRPIAVPRPLPATVRRTVPTPRPVPVPIPVLVTDDDMDRGLPVHLPQLTQSAQAYQRASQIDVRVAERLRRIDYQVT